MSSQERSKGSSPTGVAYGIDLIALVKAIAFAFVLFVLGSLAGGWLLARLLSPEQWAAANNLWVAVVAIGGFAWAGSRIGEATRPAMHGAVAALGSCLLVVLLGLIIGAPASALRVLLLALLAAVVGGIAGLAAGRRRGPVLP